MPCKTAVRRAGLIARAALLLLALCAPSASAAPLRAGAEIAFPPYSDVDADGRASGFAVELLAAVGRATGEEVTFRAERWDTVWQALLKDQLDVLPLVARMAEREGLVEFTQAHTLGYDAFFTRYGHAPIASLEQARDQSIIVLRSDAAHHALASRGFARELVPVDSLADALRLLASGQHDAVLAPQLQGSMLVTTLGLSQIVGHGPLLKEYRREFCFAVKKGHSALKTKLDQGLAIVKASGEYDRLYRKWLGIYEPTSFPLHYAFWGGTIAAAVLALLALWSLTLRRRVALRTAELLAANQAVEIERGRLREVNEALERRVAERTAALEAAKSEAERANKAKSRFLAAASHDLRQPLSALSLYVGVIDGRLAAEDAALAHNMKECLGSLSALLSSLLDLSKLEAGVVRPSIGDFHVADMLERIVSSHAPEARLKGIALRCRDTGLHARTDAVLLQRIVGNFVANAIRFTRRGGVLIGCRRRHGKAWIEVWDTGVGIPDGGSEEIFEEFKQLGNDEGNHGKGSGLGLAIAAKTAALLDVRIRMHSRLGRGSLFAVELPLGAPCAAPARREAAPGPLRIGLVEDNPDVAAALAYSLAASGHKVVAAAGAGELLARLDGGAPDIVVSDYRLAGDETGVDVIAATRAAFGAALPALIITGDTDPALLGSLAALGIRVLHKPLDFDTLRAAVAEAVAP